jgi:hypothetical protein
MTDIEFELIDNLYFVQSFEILCKTMHMNEVEMKELLLSLVQKDWVKVMDKQTDEEISDIEIWSNACARYFYLATKKGLFAHNTL